MISIVISSHLSEESNQKIKNHITDTIGLKNPEILIYENFNKYSLSEVYNIGLKESKNDIVLFIHNDIIFNTKKWGRILVDKFNNSDYGILGVAGTTDLVDNGVWWTDQSKMVGIVNHKNNNKIFESKYSNSYNKEVIEVAVIDGLFIAVNKNKIQNNFVEEFKGFHYYDIPFCIENGLKGVKIGVIFDIRLTHLSIGETNEEFHKNKEKFVEKYKKHLPYKIQVNEIKDIYTKNIQIKNEPKLSIIIPNKNNNKLLFDLLESIKEKTKYNNYKIIIADTGSDEKVINEICDYIEEIKNIKIVKYNYYNFAKINNDVVINHVDKNTELLLFLNNDIKLINDVISIMVDTYIKNKKIVGTIGARLYYPDNSIQHSGIFMNIVKNKLNLGHYGIKSYYRYHRNTINGIIGNTAACMMTPYNTFINNGMFNNNYIECFEDVEYNLKCIISNKTNIFSGNAVAYHYESQTRDLDNTKKEKMDKDYKKLLNFINDNISKLSFLIKK